MKKINLRILPVIVIAASVAFGTTGRAVAQSQKSFASTETKNSLLQKSDKAATMKCEAAVAKQRTHLASVGSRSRFRSFASGVINWEEKFAQGSDAFGTSDGSNARMRKLYEKHIMDETAFSKQLVDAYSRLQRELISETVRICEDGEVKRENLLKTIQVWEIKKSARNREREFGHEIVLIDPFNIAQCGYEPQSFNPLDCFRHDESRVVDEARRMASSLIVTTGKESERFWTDSAISVTTAMLTYLMTEAKEGASLNHLRDITSNPQMVEQILQMMLQSDKAHGLLRRLAGEIGGFEGKTKSSVYSVTNSNLSFLDSVAVGNSLCETTFDPNMLINGRCTIYLVLPIDRLKEMASLQRVILSTLINLVFAAGENPNRRVHLLLDESASLGPMDSLYNCVQFGRSFGLRSTFLFQSSSQVDRCFPESQRSDFMSTVSKVFAGSDDLDTAKSVSEMMGNSTILSVTEQTGLNDGQTGSTGIHDQTTSKNWGASSSTSFAEQSRSLMTPAEVLTLPRHLAIAILPGMSPVLIEKMPYYRKVGGGVFRRTISLLTDVAFVAITSMTLTTVVWALTFGRHEPAVTQLLDASQSFWRRYR